MKIISGKRKKTDSDYEELARLEFYGGMYLSKDGPIVPADVIEATMIGGAKKVRDGMTAKAAVFCLDHAPIEYDGPRTLDELWNGGDTPFRHTGMVRIQSNRIARTRPIFNEWAITVKVQYDPEQVNPQKVDEWFTLAGNQVGMCDWRPRYGRFTVERI